MVIWNFLEMKWIRREIKTFQTVSRQTKSDTDERNKTGKWNATRVGRLQVAA